VVRVRDVALSGGPQRGPIVSEPVFTTIEISGVEDLESPRRTLLHQAARASLRFYGHRLNDAAQRLVVVELPMEQAAHFMQETADAGGFPEMEIDDRAWAYVGCIGPGEARFKKEGA
jgi:hypothetical protein